jgi:5-methylcytosine-specific restriction enzyme A
MGTRRHKEGGWVETRDLPRGASGRPLCRQCGSETAPPRRSFCSDLCVHEWRLRTDASYLREQVFKRDHGRCALCGLDTESLRRRLFVLARRDRSAWRRLMADLRISRKRASLWDADHIVPVCEGGGECGLDNIRTLCLACHRRETDRLRLRLAERNQPMTTG